LIQRRFFRGHREVSFALHSVTTLLFCDSDSRLRDERLQTAQLKDCADPGFDRGLAARRHPPRTGTPPTPVLARPWLC